MSLHSLTSLSLITEVLKNISECSAGFRLQDIFMLWLKINSEFQYKGIHVKCSCLNQIKAKIHTSKIIFSVLNTNINFYPIFVQNTTCHNHYNDHWIWAWILSRILILCLTKLTHSFPILPCCVCWWSWQMWCLPRDSAGNSLHCFLLANQNQENQHSLLWRTYYCQAQAKLELQF